MIRGIQIPAYKCQKEIHALKILDIKTAIEGKTKIKEIVECDRILYTDHKSLVSTRVSFDFMSLYNPVVGGYVIFDLEDGSKSYIGKSDFEKYYMTEEQRKQVQIPRRMQLEKMTFEELYIYKAIQAIEKLPADVRLTEAVSLLQQAKECVADYVDGVVRPTTTINFEKSMHRDGDE